MALIENRHASPIRFRRIVKPFNIENLSFEFYTSFFIEIGIRVIGYGVVGNKEKLQI